MTSNKPTHEGLMEFYTKVLHSLSLQVDDAGLISMELGGMKVPSTIEDKRMVIPTREVLRESDWDNFVGFHPLSENVCRGESKVLKKLKALVNFRLTSTMSMLIAELIELAANHDMHCKLTPKQSELLTVITKADARSIADFKKIIDSVSPSGENRIVSIYLKRGGKIGEESFSRAAITTFPVAEEFDNDERDIFGVKLRVKDFTSFKNLFNYMVPDYEIRDFYSYGSRSLEAPYFDALMNAYIKVAKALNKVTKAFKKFLDNPDELMIDLSWESQMKDLSFYKDLVPTLKHNDGEIGVEEKMQGKAEEQSVAVGQVSSGSVFNTKPTLTKPETSSAMDKIASSIPATNPVQEAPKVEEKEESSGGLSWQEIMAKKNQVQQQQAPYGYPQPQATAWNQTPPWQQTPQQPVVPPGFAGSNVVVGQQQPQYAAPVGRQPAFQPYGATGYQAPPQQAYQGYGSYGGGI